MALIYIPIWIDYNQRDRRAENRDAHLHSNMDRLKQVSELIAAAGFTPFTFQYG